jgi:ABC-2 type transport system permease protein
MTARLLRRGLAGTLFLLLGVIIFEMIIPPVADEVGTQQLNPVLESLPPAIVAISRSSPDIIIGSGLQGYLSVGFTNPIYLVIIAAAVTAFTATTLAGEMESGTIQLPLSRAVSRHQVYAARAIGVVIIAVLFAAAAPLGIWIGLQQVSTTDPVYESYLIPTGVASFALLWAIAGGSLFLSAVGSSTGRVVGWVLGWLMISYFFDYFSTLWSALEPFTPLSIYDYFRPTETLIDGTYEVRDMVVLGAVGFVGFIVGHLVFVRRDLPA